MRLTADFIIKNMFVCPYTYNLSSLVQVFNESE